MQCQAVQKHTVLLEQLTGAAISYVTKATQLAGNIGNDGTPSPLLNPQVPVPQYAAQRTACVKRH